MCVCACVCVHVCVCMCVCGKYSTLKKYCGVIILNDTNV